MNRQLRYTFLSLLIVTSLILQPFLGAFQPSVVQAQSDSNTVYLPVVAGGATNNAAPPQFEISSPITGSTLSRVFNFAIQSVSVNEISSVTFKAGNTTLGSDISSADGFSIFVDASNMVTGTIQLSAIAKGAGGESTKTVTISVIPNPPSSATVGTSSSVLATEIGSTISILPNSLPQGATVSITELTQEQVTSQNGIRWDDIGVTFLGAQEIKSSAPFSRPLGSVVSAGFGNRVQPGQAVVNYRLGPDVDGDGAGEIVVVNTASVAPNGDVVGDVNSLPIVRSVQLNQARDLLVTKSFDKAMLNAPLGTIVKIKVNGFNPLSISGNVATFQSSIDTSTFEMPGSITVDATDNSSQWFSTQIPPFLPLGAATLTLRNESNGLSTQPIYLNIEKMLELTAPAKDIIQEFFTHTTTLLENSNYFTSTEESEKIQQVLGELHDVQDKFDELLDMVQTLGPGEQRNRLEQALNGVALSFQNTLFIQYVTATGSNPQEDIRQILGDLSHALTVGGWILSGAGFLLLGTPVGSALSITGSILRAAGLGIKGALLLDKYCDYCKPSPPCVPTQGPNGPTGMGSAPPPGGNGCGGIGGGGNGGNNLIASGASATSPFSSEPGRYRIKVYRRDFSGNPLSPFTAVNDAGGYFFLPLIPQDEPFTAVAVDKQTGLAVTYDGIGPKEGTSTFMFFDFSDQKRTAFPIHIGDTISANVPISGAGRIEWPGTIDVYTFTASAGQFISFTLQSADFSLTPLRVRLQSPSGNTLVDTRFATGTSKNFFLPQAGDYTLTINEIEGRSKGEYQFTTFKLPVELFGIAIGNTIANHSPAAGAGNIETIGAKDIYTFSVPARQRLFFNLLDVTAVPNITWQLVDSSDTILFENPFSFGDPGVRTLVNGGIYTLTVGTTNIQTGTYSFKIWNVPDPQQFAISVGSTVSDGLPASGAGKIETPGTKDQYTFTASAGQHIYFDLITGLENIPWKAVDAKGSVIFEGNLTDGDPGERTLSQGGTYTITVGSDFQATTGSYSFQIRNP